METKPKLLNYFEPNFHGAVLNLIFQPLRAGLTSELEILKNINDNYQDAKSRGWSVADTREKFNQIQTVPDFLLLFSEAVAYCIEWEKKPYEEKQRIKQMQNYTFAQKAMAGKPPTEKQLAFLKKKGVNEIPANRLAASELIDKIINAEKQ